VAGRIIFEPALEKHIVIVRLDNPGQKNAINLEMWHQLAEIASQIVDHTSVRVVIITGSAEVFSSGADITDFNSARSDEVSGQSYDDLVEKTCRKVEAIPQPTICAIEGLCIGAGASLACSCDLRLASEKTAFGKKSRPTKYPSEFLRRPAFQKSDRKGPEECSSRPLFRSLSLQPKQRKYPWI
jgi:enoyl-CoA hydratase/carnithine racemase